MTTQPQPNNRGMTEMDELITIERWPSTACVNGVRVEQYECQTTLTNVAAKSKYYLGKTEKSAMRGKIPAGCTIEYQPPFDKFVIWDACEHCDGSLEGWVHEACGVITPAQFAERMQVAVAGTDDESNQCDSTDLMELVLRRLGYGEGCDIFAKWYR
jgi:hypothetical protein